MSRQKNTCPRCFGQKSIHASQCRQCLRESTNSKTCPVCGGQKNYASKLCRRCRSGRGHACQDCGSPLKGKGNHRCRECYEKSRQRLPEICIDCGKSLGPYAYWKKAKRCLPCEMQRRRNLPKKQCSVSGCLRPHQAKGLCSVHYISAFRRQSRGLGIGSSLRKILSSWPCQLCGYAKMPSDVHRLVPGAEGGAYVAGNIVALCCRCHREVHRGLAKSPVAPSEAEIRATVTHVTPACC